MSDDDDLFRKIFADVVPIKKPKPLIKQKSLKSHVSKNKYRQAQQRAQEFSVEPSNHLDDSDPEQYLNAQSELSFRRPGVQISVFHKLKRAKLPIDSSIDLHGYTVAQVRHNLSDFIQQARQQNCSCILIIHGKGQRNDQQHAILKTHVANWLMQIDDVLAYHSAQQKDGGLGALYVLLRKIKSRIDDDGK